MYGKHVAGYLSGNGTTVKRGGMIWNIADMYDLSSSLFWYKIVFLIELFVAGSLIGGKLRRRQPFAARLAASVLMLFAVTFALPILSYSSFYTMVLFFVIFALFLCATKFSRDENWSSILFCGCWAYTVQHISYQIYTIYIRRENLSRANMRGFRCLFFSKSTPSSTSWYGR